MVKRPPTPPPPDDEPRYLTVTCPYPPYANLEKHEELIPFIRWLACAMKGDYQSLYAVFHKPSAANMVIIEVSRNFPHFRSLLGEHKWSEFVLNPGPHHDKKTCIYYSTYSSGRAVEKAGWKRIFVEDVWFERWHPRNQYIAYPYPLSSYCEVPPEDRTSMENCRPLPVDLFNMRVPAPPPVPVGSAAWLATKTEGGDKNFKEKNNANTLATVNGEPRKAPLLSHSPFEPIVSNYVSSRSTTRLTSTSKSDAASDTESVSTLQTKRSIATDVSGTAITVNGNTVTWEFEDTSTEAAINYEANPNEEYEDETDEYTANCYYFNEVEKPTTNSASSTSPFLVHKDKPPCPTHGTVCKSSICKDYNAYRRKMEKRKEEEQKWQQMEHRPWRGRHRGRGRGNWGRSQTRETGHSQNVMTGYSKENGTGTRTVRTQASEISGLKENFSKPSSRIDDEPFDNRDDNVYNMGALSASLASESTSARSLSSDKSISSTIESGLEFQYSEAKPALNAWAKGNPLAPQRKLSSEGTCKDGLIKTAIANGHFPALQNEIPNGIAKQSARPAVASASFAASVKAPVFGSRPSANQGPPSSAAIFVKQQVAAPGTGSSAQTTNNIQAGTRSASVMSWAKIASRTSTPGPAGLNTSGTGGVNAVPPTMGRVITSSTTNIDGGSKVPLTVDWEEFVATGDAEDANLEEW